MKSKETPDSFFEKSVTFSDNLWRVKTKLLDELEEIVTNPDNKDVPISTFEDLQKGRKINSSILLWNKVSRIGQDLRIDPSQMDGIKEEIFD